nr:unnamed protein product [Callosobruchus analis]
MLLEGFLYRYKSSENSEIFLISFILSYRSLERDEIIKEKLDSVYGRGSAPYSAVGKTFSHGPKLIQDDERPGRPVEVITDDKVSLVKEFVLSDRRLKSVLKETSKRDLQEDLPGVPEKLESLELLGEQ